MTSFRQDVAVLLGEFRSPKQRSAALARFAREEIEKTRKANEAAIGRKMRPPSVTVDGRAGAPLASVTPNGTIVATFDVETNAVRWILSEIRNASPELTGAYQRSHVLFADGVEIAEAGELPTAREFVIASDLPYAKKLDPKDGLPARSKQAPKGVYAAVAAVARRRFAGEVQIFFTFREIPLARGGMTRNPAIVVRMD